MKIKIKIIIIFVSILYFPINSDPDKKIEENNDGKLPNIKIMKVVSNGTKLFLRQNPSLEAKIILNIDDGSYVELLEILNETTITNKATENWTKISYDDKVGWVLKVYLRDLRKASVNTIEDCPVGGLESGDFLEDSFEKTFGKQGDLLPYKNPISGKSIKNIDVFDAYNQKYNGNILLSSFSKRYYTEYIIVFKKRSFKDVFQKFQLCDSRLTTDKDLSVIDKLYFDFLDYDEPYENFRVKFNFLKKGKDTIVTYTWSSYL